LIWRTRRTSTLFEAFVTKAISVSAGLPGPRSSLGGSAPNLGVLRRRLPQTGPGLRRRPCGKLQGKSGKKIRRRIIRLAYRAGMIRRHLNRQNISTARGILNPSLSRIGAEQLTNNIVGHDGELLFGGELPNRGVVREFSKAHAGEHVDQFGRGRLDGANRRGTERNESGEREAPET
jgi:hypothetical protein